MAFKASHSANDWWRRGTDFGEEWKRDRDWILWVHEDRKDNYLGGHGDKRFQFFSLMVRFRLTMYILYSYVVLVCSIRMRAWHIHKATSKMIGHMMAYNENLPYFGAYLLGHQCACMWESLAAIDLLCMYAPLVYRHFSEPSFANTHCTCNAFQLGLWSLIIIMFLFWLIAWIALAVASDKFIIQHRTCNVFFFFFVWLLKYYLYFSRLSDDSAVRTKIKQPEGTPDCCKN